MILYQPLLEEALLLPKSQFYLMMILLEEVRNPESWVRKAEKDNLESLVRKEASLDVCNQESLVRKEAIRDVCNPESWARKAATPAYIVEMSVRKAGTLWEMSVRTEATPAYIVVMLARNQVHMLAIRAYIAEMLAHKEAILVRIMEVHPAHIAEMLVHIAEMLVHIVEMSAHKEANSAHK
jgi:hypothetical protein